MFDIESVIISWQLPWLSSSSSSCYTDEFCTHARTHAIISHICVYLYMCMCVHMYKYIEIGRGGDTYQHYKGVCHKGACEKGVCRKRCVAAFHATLETASLLHTRCRVFWLLEFTTPCLEVASSWNLVAQTHMKVFPYGKGVCRVRVHKSRLLEAPVLLATMFGRCRCNAFDPSLKSCKPWKQSWGCRKNYRVIHTLCHGCVLRVFFQAP